MRAPLGLLFVLFALPGAALDLFGREEAARRFPEGAQLYERHCAACHDRGDARTPSASLLFDMAPEAVLAALTDGPMRAQGAALSPAERRAVAEFLTNRRLEPGRARAEPRCEGAAARFDFSAPPPFWNWGLDRGGRHFVPGAVAGIHRDNVARLRLRWVHAFPGSQRMRSQPALAGGAVIAGSHAGRVRALDLETGCLRWEFRADAEVRTAVVISPWPAGDASARPLAYFGDLRANVYAVEAATGRLVWKARLDDHTAAVITGAPALHRGVLYVPVSSLEEAAAAAPGYPCCTFRGAVAALDAASGRLLWRTFLVPEPRPRPPPGPAFGPSGVAVWMSPTVDKARGLLFVATGDNYSDPATELSDAVVALDLKSGAIRWHRQLLAGDAWNVDCFARLAGNCPEEAGSDHDFGAGLILAPAPGGRELLFAGQKSGVVYALDPADGALVWQTRVGRGGPAGGIVFGMAANAERLFVPVFDLHELPHLPRPPRPGLHALDLASGRPLWYAPAPDACGARPGCARGSAGTPTATETLVFAPSEDGHLRAYDAATGALLWAFDTAREWPAVNGVPGRGGAISGGAAPLPWRGRLIAVSGYGFAGRMSGNLLMVFAVEDPPDPAAGSRRASPPAP